MSHVGTCARTQVCMGLRYGLGFNRACCAGSTSASCIFGGPSSQDEVQVRDLGSGKGLIVENDKQSGSGTSRFLG